MPQDQACIPRRKTNAEILEAALKTVRNWALPGRPAIFKCDGKLHTEIMPSFVCRKPSGTLIELYATYGKIHTVHVKTAKKDIAILFQDEGDGKREYDVIVVDPVRGGLLKVGHHAVKKYDPAPK
jgi:hypothetical protein